MKRSLCLVFMALAFLVSIAGCAGKDAAVDMDADRVPVVDTEKVKVVQKLSDLKYYYVPTNIVTNIKPDDVLVEDNHVCASYYLEDLDLEAMENAGERETARIRNTVKLEWIAKPDGLLQKTIDELQLEPMDEEGVYYYADILSPSDPGMVLGKSIYWTEDRHMFNLEVPIELFDRYTETGIKELAYVRKIAVIAME